MEDRQIVSPFSKTVSTDLLKTFVGRHEELSLIREEFERNRKGILIVGSAGSGKTSLARMFAHQYHGMFLGGIYGSSANWAESPRHLFDRLLLHMPTAKTLMIVDEIDAFEDAEIYDIKKAAYESQHLHLLFTSRRRLGSLSDFYTLTLNGLTMAEFHQLLRIRNSEAHILLDDQTFTRLFHLAGGSPVFAQLAASVVGAKQVGSWEELLGFLRTFRTPGLLGPDGRPLVRGTPAYSEVIIDVTRTNDEIIKCVRENPEIVWRLPPRKFEEIVAQILYKQGYEIELTPASGDGGFDIYAARKDWENSCIWWSVSDTFHRTRSA